MHTAQNRADATKLLRVAKAPVWKQGLPGKAKAVCVPCQGNVTLGDEVDVMDVMVFDREN